MEAEAEEEKSLIKILLWEIYEPEWILKYATLCVPQVECVQQKSPENVFLARKKSFWNLTKFAFWFIRV